MTSNWSEFQNAEPSPPLYPVEPIGTGTPYAESLTSYIKRLSFQHGWFPKTLHNDIIHADTDRKLHYKSTGGINRANDLAQKWIQWLSKLTGQSDLADHTLCPLKKLDFHSVLDKHIRWCPDCIQEQRNSNREIHEPLLWFFRSIRFCTKHQKFLRKTCPSCTESLYPIGAKSLPGLCDYCRMDLGDPPEYDGRFWKNLNNEEQRWEQWKTNQISNLIAALPDLELCSIGTLKNSIVRIIEQRFQYQAHCARWLKISKGTIQHWHKKRYFPCFEYLLRLLFASSTDLVEFFTNETPNALSCYQSIGPWKDVQNYDLEGNPDKKKIKEKLNTILERSRVKSLTWVVAELEVSIKFINKHFVEEKKQLKTKIKQYKADQKALNFARFIHHLHLVFKELLIEGRKISRKLAQEKLPKPGHLINERKNKAFSALKNHVQQEGPQTNVNPWDFVPDEMLQKSSYEVNDE